MKTLLLVALFATIARAVNVYDVVLDEWSLYKTTRKRNFRSSDEEIGSLRQFLQSKQLIAEHNERYAKGLESYRLNLNQFADWDPFGHIDEKTYVYRYMEERTQLRKASAGSKITVPPDAILPDSIDWREDGVVSSIIIDQGSCGSCYAITTAAVMEALMNRRDNEDIRLSAQQIVDCSTSFGNLGCNGGTFSNTFAYLTTTGLVPYETYPYENKDNGYCKLSSAIFSDRVKHYYYMFDGNEEKLKYALATYGPVAVGINASKKTFQFYGGGVYNDTSCGPTLVHAVLLIGYGTDPETNQDYWLLKNSWGANWGEEGFMRISRNRNLCGIGTLAYAATLE